jgi:hypothetical protein
MDFFRLFTPRRPSSRDFLSCDDGSLNANTTHTHTTQRDKMLSLSGQRPTTEFRVIFRIWFLSFIARALVFLSLFGSHEHYRLSGADLIVLNQLFLYRLLSAFRMMNLIIHNV